jgi:hypothetical protein
MIDEWGLGPLSLSAMVFASTHGSDEAELGKQSC